MDDTIRDMRGLKYGKLPEKVLYSTKLSSNDKVVYAVLDKHAGNESATCFPGQRRISKLTGLGLSSVNRSIKFLAKTHFIKIEKKVSHKGLRNEYVLLPLR